MDAQEAWLRCRTQRSKQGDYSHPDASTRCRCCMYGKKGSIQDETLISPSNSRWINRRPHPHRPGSILCRWKHRKQNWIHCLVCWLLRLHPINEIRTRNIALLTLTHSSHGQVKRVWFSISTWRPRRSAWPQQWITPTMNRWSIILKVTSTEFTYLPRYASVHSVTDAATTASERVRSRLEQLDAFEVNWGSRVVTDRIRVFQGRTADTKSNTTRICQPHQRHEQGDEPSMEKWSTRENIEDRHSSMFDRHFCMLSPLTPSDA